MIDNILEIKDFSFSYGDNTVLKDTSFAIEKQKITAIHGTSGSGKSTFLKACALLFRETTNTSVSGQIFFHGQDRSLDILSLKKDFWKIRRKLVYIAQNPNPLNMSIYKNIAFPLKISGLKNKEENHEKILESLKSVHLYEDVKNRLDESALDLSGGQQQRLCIARAMVLQPEILLLDEPTSSLDTSNKHLLEELIIELGNSRTIVFASHDMNQIERIADHTLECIDNNIVKTTD